MSLSELPTELDAKIIEFLHAADDRQAVSSMSRVSKYYRQLAEPFLYRDLVFRAADEIRIKRLLITLLVETELAKHIRSFSLSDHRPLHPDYPSYYEKADILAGELGKYDSLIKKAIGLVPLPASTAMHMFGSIFARGGTIYRPEHSIDGTIALILSMAHDIKSIHLAVSAPGYLDITRELLNGPWTAFKNGTFDSTKAFSKLESLRIKGDGIQDPGMAIGPQGVTRKLILQKLHIAAVGTILGSTDALCSLELRNVKIMPALVEDLIKRSALVNLSRLVLDGLIDVLPQSWARYDYASLSQVIVDFLPNLEVLECVHMQTSQRQEKRPFASLRPLARLHTLRVDVPVLIDLATDDSDEDVSFDGQAILPPSLRHLELVESSTWQIDVLVNLEVVANPGISMNLETFSW